MHRFNTGVGVGVAVAAGPVVALLAVALLGAGCGGSSTPSAPLPAALTHPRPTIDAAVVAANAAALRCLLREAKARRVAAG